MCSYWLPYIHDSAVIIMIIIDRLKGRIRYISNTSKPASSEQNIAGHINWDLRGGKVISLCLLRAPHRD